MEKIKITIPVSAIIPTANRPVVLMNTLLSVAEQSKQPAEIIIIDASDSNETYDICINPIDGLIAEIKYLKARVKGAAIQRTQGYELSSLPFIFFMDDDILLEDGCVEKLWNYLQVDPQAGGVNAMITNQQYQNPGKVTGFMYRLMNGQELKSYAGKCIGPAWNLLPQDIGATVNEVEWLNAGCTIYRRESLPSPLFYPWFSGYSLMEDLALSLTVAKKWKLFNVREAKIFHDSQPGFHKDRIIAFSKMELVNRHYVMTKIMDKKGIGIYLKLLVFELWGMISILNTKTGWENLLPTIIGKFAGIGNILFSKK